jgi:hypothetical protein
LARTVFTDSFLAFKLKFKSTQIAHKLAYNLFT